MDAAEGVEAFVLLVYARERESRERVVLLTGTWCTGDGAGDGSRGGHTLTIIQTHKLPLELPYCTNYGLIKYHMHISYLPTRPYFV